MEGEFGTTPVGVLVRRERAGSIRWFSAIRPLAARNRHPESCSGDVQYGVIGEGNGNASGQRRLGTAGCASLHYRIPRIKVPEDAFDDIGIFDKRDDAHGGAAASSLNYY